MEKQKNSPKKGAAKRLAERLKELGEQTPSKELLAILNRPKKSEKIAAKSNNKTALEI